MAARGTNRENTEKIFKLKVCAGNGCGTPQAQAQKHCRLHLGHGEVDL